MSTAVRMQEMVQFIGRPPSGGEHISFQIKRARYQRARKLESMGYENGLSLSKTTQYWYNYKTPIIQEHYEAAEALMNAPEIKAARHEFRELEEQINQLEAASSVGDEDFYRPTINAMRTMARLASIVAPWVSEDETR